jgi:ADP-heptose:LPS heptosyltransferase
VNSKNERILIIRLGALGDLVFCFQSFYEIRQAHPNAEIVLLTRPPFASFARSLPWIDRVILDTHPTWKTPLEWLKLRKEILELRPTRIYDLQGKRRQSILYSMLGGPFGAAWSGAAPLCKFPRPWPPAPGMHFMDFLAAQLRVAGVRALPAPELSWLDAPIERFGLPERYAVLIPGCSPNAPHKRWPPERFAELAGLLRNKGLACVTIGTEADAGAVAEIKANAAELSDLCGQTSLFELAGILRGAAVVVGNDTGPIHMGAAVGAPTVALFSGRSSKVWSKPPGEKVVVVQSPHLGDLEAAAVLAAVEGISRT